MGKHLILGVQFAGAIILGVYAGLWADKRFGASPWGVLVGAGLGFAGGFYSLYRVAMGSDNNDTATRGGKRQ